MTTTKALQTLKSGIARRADYKYQTVYDTLPDYPQKRQRYSYFDNYPTTA